MNLDNITDSERSRSKESNMSDLSSRNEAAGRLFDDAYQSMSAPKTPLERQGYQRKGFHYEKTEPLPKDWSSMSPEMREKWLRDAREKELSDLGLGPGGPRLGRQEDPFTGERGWMGYAGQLPSASDEEWIKQGPRYSL